MQDRRRKISGRRSHRSDNGGRAVGAVISRGGNWIMKNCNDMYDFYDLNGLNDFNELTDSLIP